jgi:general secretion pathway protein B
MSYILDALKKSEQERQKTTGPTLQTIHRPLFADSRKSGAFWGVMLLCVVLSVSLMATTWRYLLSDKSASGNSVSESQVLLSDEMSKSHSDPSVITSTNSSSAQVPSGITMEPESVPRASEDSQFDLITPSSSNSRKVKNIVEFWELPDPVQQEIPAMTFSFHVYSDNVDRRTIIINNRRVKEGDKISDGLRLREITVDGVVLSWKRFYFRVNVVEQW